MGQYINPPSEVQRRGRLLQMGSYQELTEQLKPGELLFGLFDRGMFIQAPFLYSRAEFEEFKRQELYSCQFYGLESSVAAELKIKF